MSLLGVLCSERFHTLDSSFNLLLIKFGCYRDILKTHVLHETLDFIQSTSCIMDVQPGVSSQVWTEANCGIFQADLDRVEEVARD